MNVANLHRELLAYFATMPDGTETERLALERLAAYETDCLYLTQEDMTAEQRYARVVEMSRCLLRSLHALRVETEDVQVFGESADAPTRDELSAALVRLLVAWDSVGPLGWVASRQGDPRELVAAVAAARAVARRLGPCPPLDLVYEEQYGTASARPEQQWHRPIPPADYGATVDLPPIPEIPDLPPLE